MLLPLLVYIIVGQCTVIQFLWSEGVKPYEIDKRMKAQYRDVYYTKESVPMGGKETNWQNKNQ